MRQTTLTCSASDRERFRQGTLWKQWAREYPSAFDEADVRLVAPRAPYGRLFFEWFVAAHYARQGYCVLVGKYQFWKAHPGKAMVFRRVAPPLVLDLLTNRNAFGRRQGPDLFVYSKDESEWFFAEVKGPGDTLSLGQAEFFREIERRSGGKDIELVRAVCVRD
jgi:hypothetical protein